MYATNKNHYEKEDPELHSARSSIITLGETTFRKQHRAFGMLPEDRLRHLYVLGKTGSGKSTLLQGLLAQDLAAGTGLALLDPHGDLVEAVLPLVPPRRTNDVLLFAPADADHPVSFNVFRHGRALHPSAGLLSSELVSVFKKHWADAWGPRLEHILRNAILAVAGDPRATLLFLYRFLTEEQLREKVVAKVTDPVVKLFWTREFPGYRAALQAEALSPVLNKLGAFVSLPAVRAIVSQERNRVDLVRLMQGSGVLLANLATAAIGEDASHLLGGLLLTSIQFAAMSRPRGSAPFLLYVDEFQNFVTDSLATVLAESRKFGLGLVLAHQYLAQLPVKLQEAVLGNVGSMVLFRVGATDASVLSPEFAPNFSAADLAALPRYEIAVKLLVSGVQLPAFSARTLPPPETPEDREARVAAIVAQSRSRYASQRQGVDTAIRKALGAESPPPFGV